MFGIAAAHKYCVERCVFTLRKAERLRPVLTYHGQSCVEGRLIILIFGSVDLISIVGVVRTAVCRGCKHLDILKFIIDDSLVVVFLVNGNYLNDVALLELSGKTVCKAADGHGHRSFVEIKLTEQRVGAVDGIRQLAG